MNFAGKHYRSIWMEKQTVFMVDQNVLPFEFKIFASYSCSDTCKAIIDMTTRGAGAIGVAAGFAMAQACMENGSLYTSHPEQYKSKIESARKQIESTRPTARNLFYATELVFASGIISPDSAYETAQWLAEQNLNDAIKIGEFGNTLIKNNARILTHCNAGWLAFVDYGSALSPIYVAQQQGKDVFVYVDETRPRLQGARLTAWELKNQGINHTLVPDNAAAYLMSKGLIDMVITGADRIAANADTANKIGTFEKAILAKEFGIPFYIAAPLSTFDMDIEDGNQIIIEERNADEVLYATGPDQLGAMHTIRLASEGITALNPAFDVTPATYISGIITEKGVILANRTSITGLFTKF